jgi:hypothetical protein
MKSKPAIDQFLEAGDKAHQAPDQKASPKVPEYRQSVVARLPISQSIRLKKLALKLTEETYSRVTTQALLEQAVEDLLQKHGL